MEFDLAHLERGRVPVAHQIADQTCVVLNGFGALTVRHTRRLTDRSVIAHVVHNPNKAVIQHGFDGVEVAFHPLGNSPQCLTRCRAKFGNLGLLFGGNGHFALLGDW